VRINKLPLSPVDVLDLIQRGGAARAAKDVEQLVPAGY